MPRQGLTQRIVVEKAAQLIEETGYGQLTIQALAARLNVKPSSLYKHIDGMEQLTVLLSLLSLERIKTACRQQTAGFFGKDALSRTAFAYRDFALCSPQLYKAMIRVPQLEPNPQLHTSMHELWQMIFEQVLESGISEEEAVHFTRMYRSQLHGFIALEEAGYFTNSGQDREESFRWMVSHLLLILDQARENRPHIVSERSKNGTSN